MAVQGNDHSALRAQWDAALQRRNEIHGGIRLLFGDDTLELRPGRLTFHQRREIRRALKSTVEELIFEMGSGEGSPETVAGLAWVAAYQDDPSNPPDIDSVLAWVETLDPRVDIDVEVFDGSDDDAEVVDAADPTQSGPSSQGSELSPLLLPDLG